MAEKLGMSESQMSQHVSGGKNIGPRLARRIEKELDLPHGWMDNEHNDLTDETVEFAREFQRLTPEQRRNIQALIRSFKR